MSSHTSDASSRQTTQGRAGGHTNGLRDAPGARRRAEVRGDGLVLDKARPCTASLCSPFCVQRTTRTGYAGSPVRARAVRGSSCSPREVRRASTLPAPALRLRRGVTRYIHPIYARETTMATAVQRRSRSPTASRAGRSRRRSCTHVCRREKKKHALAARKKILCQSIRQSISKLSCCLISLSLSHCTHTQYARCVDGCT